MTDDTNAPEVNEPNVGFYDSFIGVMKWSVVALALLLIVMAVFLVR